MDDHDNDKDQNKVSAGLESQKTKAEISKLEWEINELRDRINKRKNNLYKLFMEVIVGGAVAGGLFYVWFTGFYSPIVEIQNERLEFAKEKLTHELQVESRKSSKINSLLEEQTDYLRLVGKLNAEVKSQLDQLQSRLSSNENSLRSDYDTGRDIAAEGLIAYFKGEVEEIKKLNGIIVSSIEGGKVQVKTALKEIEKSSNKDFSISIIYDRGFSNLANQVDVALRSQGFSVSRLERWVDFREDGDGPMSRFFRKGSVIWYDKSHLPTHSKLPTLKENLRAVFPDNMTVHSGDTIVVPGVTWSTPEKYHFQIWLF